MAAPASAPTISRPERLKLLGHPLDPVSLDVALDLLSAWITESERTTSDRIPEAAANGPRTNSPRTPHTVVTLNPEFIMQIRAGAAGSAEFAGAIDRADLVTADGVGVVWAARQLLGTEVPRAPGFDLATGLMKRHGAELRVFFLGAKPGVAELAAQRAHEQYGVVVAGVHHGYFDAAEDVRVAELIRDSGADLLLTAMGAARQELFNEYWRGVLNVPVMMGVGGVLDVLAGTASLAPAWTRRLGVEWVWRVAADRRRWGRAPALARFVALVRGEQRRKS